MRGDLPTGEVTFLFTDIEGSTKLVSELGAEAFAEALAAHRKVLREAFTRHGGVEVDTQGDAFFYAFPTSPEAIAAARDGQQELAAGPIRVRVGIHTGTPYVTDEGYVGDDVHKGARIAAAGHGGQVLLSKEAAALAEGELTDLGEHRVKDFVEPVWIFQLGPQRFPPLKTISNTNLPYVPSSFVGRESELKEIRRLFEDGARLVTLTGPGGSGKMRLAIEVASALIPEHKNGVFWIGLASLRDAAVVSEEIAKTLGAQDGLAEHIGEREMLLLLDNFEQVVDAAPELSALLAACPHLQLLVTSREILRISGEVEYAVPPMTEGEAVELFCKRSQLNPDHTIAELCRRLDSLPLAVELAAARARVLTPEQILERIDKRLDLLKGGRDAESRQKTLRATIEWSHDLLKEEEKTLFARLAVFAGGCTLEAAEQVAQADVDVLQSLVEKSLVRHTDDRFWMLETIYEYAADRLETLGDATARRLHAEFFLNLVEGAAPFVQRARADEGWLDRLEREHDNLRAALDTFERNGDTQGVLRMTGALFDFWGERGHLAEGFHRLERALAADDRPTPARAKALTGSATLVSFMGDLELSRIRAEESLALHRKLEDASGIARAIHTLGYAVAEQGDWSRGRDLFEESVRRFREVGDEQFALWATRSLAWTHIELGDRERGRRLHEENLAAVRELGEEKLEVVTLGVLALLAADDGRSEESLPLLKESLQILGRIGDPLDVAEHFCRCAYALAAGGRAEPAARLLGCAVALLDEMGSKQGWVDRDNERTLGAVRAVLDESEFVRATEQGAKLTIDDAIAFAIDSFD